MSDWLREQELEHDLVAATARAEQAEMSIQRIWNLHHRIVVRFYEGRPNEHTAFARKCHEEAGELADDPDDLTEAADVLICLLGYLHARELTWNDLLASAEQKMTVNEARQWVKAPDGTWKHVTTTDGAP